MTKASKDRRSEILAAATQLFRTRGFHGTRMDDVADAVKLNKGTVYHYYDSKSTILFEIYMIATNEVLTTLPTASASTTAREQLSQLVRNTFRLIAAEPSRAAVYFQEAPYLDEWLSLEQLAQIRAREHIFTSTVRDIIKRGIDAGEFADHNVTVMAYATIAICTSFYRWYSPSRHLTIEEASDALVEIMLSGMVLPGHQTRNKSGALAPSRTGSAHRSATTRRGRG